MVEKISLEVTKRALEDYEKRHIIIPPEELEMDEEQEMFLQGYICGKKGQERLAGEVEEDDIRKQILQIRSKYCEPILEILGEEGELYHGDLAERLNVAPSGLNLAVKKMLESSPPIIEMTEIGKYKIYSLPPRIKKYVANKKNNNEYGEVLGLGDVERDNLFLCLQHFIEVAGVKWKDKLNLLLQEKEKEEKKEVVEEFRRMMQIIVYVSQYDQEEMAELKRFLNNDALVYLLQRYLEIDKAARKVINEINAKEGGARLLQHIKNIS
ncbi:MAG: hypothetical protein K2O65_03350 [Lachnospiraceae bacterium]|nr:hypothetical protein [Lachnospiraceae bacterium]